MIRFNIGDIVKFDRRYEHQLVVADWVGLVIASDHVKLPAGGVIEFYATIRWFYGPEEQIRPLSIEIDRLLLHDGAWRRWA